MSEHSGIQSPKSQRPHAPGENPASDSDNQPKNTQGGLNPQRHAAGSSLTPQVPAGLQHDGGAHQGNVEAESAVPVHSPAPHQGGGPGFAKDKGDGARKGGTKEVA